MGGACRFRLQKPSQGLTVRGQTMLSKSYFLRTRGEPGAGVGIRKGRGWRGVPFFYFMCEIPRNSYSFLAENNHVFT